MTIEKDEQLRQAEYQMWEWVKSVEKADPNSPRIIQRFKQQTEFVLGQFPMVEKKELIDMCRYL